MAKNGASVSVEGLAEVDAALGALGKSLGKAVLRRVLTRRAQPIAEAARNLVPVETGHLRDSIVVSTKLRNPAGKDAFAAVMRAGGSRQEAVAALREAQRDSGNSTVTVYVGAGPLPYAHLVEFGSVHNQPQPFLRPAWEEGKDKLLEGIGDDLWTEIEKTAARKAARVAKKAAGG